MRTAEDRRPVHCPFSEALKPHYNDALRYCRALCAPWSVAHAEDVLQQALLDAYAHFGELREPAKFKSWLFRIITRAAGRASRRRIWARILPLDECVGAGRMPTVYSARSRSSEKEILLNALSRLSSKEREAVLLFELGGFSLQEIRRIQDGRSLSATKSRLSRARRRLRAIIEEADGSSLRGSNLRFVDLERETLRLVADAELRKSEE